MMKSELFRLLRIYNSEVAGLDCDLVHGNRHLSLTMAMDDSLITLVGYENGIEAVSGQASDADVLGDWLRWLVDHDKALPW